MMNNESSPYKYDLFISHASEDKETFVRKFAAKLHNYGLKVWYDEFTLQVGDSLSKKIDEGLVQSRYGVVILSGAFIKKPWPDYELRSLLALQIGKEKRILPIWHELNREELLQHKPILADIVALDTQAGIDFVALSVIKVVRPEIFESLKALFRFRQMVASAEPKTVRASELTAGPHRRDRLSDGQMRRVRIICALLEGISPLSFERSYDSFLRDVPVEDEIQIWEWIALIVFLYKNRSECSISDAKELLFSLLFANLGVIAQQLNDEFQADKVRDSLSFIKAGIDVDLLLSIIRETNQHLETE